MFSALQLTANYSQPEESLLLLLLLLLLLFIIIIIKQHPRALKPYEALWIPAEASTNLSTSDGWKSYLAWVIVIE